MDELDKIFQEHAEDNLANLFPTHGFDEWFKELRNQMNEQKEIRKTLDDMNENLPGRFWRIFKGKHRN